MRSFVSFLLAATLVASTDTLPPLAIDQGASGVWQKLLKLQTTASVLHTTAHPDDEHSGVLTALSRGVGARVGLLTLNRGEAGDNAIGAELFDALGLIRTDELARAGQYYGLDAQYFTLVADYGYSKRLDEALTEWDRDLILKDMVRAIRRFRPLVVLSRWQGGPRDGHGQHQAAGALTPPAVAAAADASRFPELEREGLRAWRVLKLYAGGARENDQWQVVVETGTYNPVLGDSYANIGRTGLSLQRSQTSGRNNRTDGPAPVFYTRLDRESSSLKETTIFDGLDTSLPGIYRALDRTAPAGAVDRLAAIAREARAALDAFSWRDPSASAPALARGLDAVRRARAAATDPDVHHVLDVKTEQFGAALAAALGLQVTAIAQSAGLSDSSGPFAAFAAPPTLEPVTGGQTVDVRVVIASRSERPVTITSATLEGPALKIAVDRAAGVVSGTSSILGRTSMTVPVDAPVTRPYFTRQSIAETRYTTVDQTEPGRPFAPPLFNVAVECVFDGVQLQVRVPVLRREAQLPYGYVLRELEVLPPVGVTLTPAVMVITPATEARSREMQVEVTANSGAGVSGEVALELPEGWTSTPARHPLALAAGGERARLKFAVNGAALPAGQHRARAVVRIGGRSYATGYQVINHRDLPRRYLVREAAALLAPIAVKVRPGLRVGYVMGVGDEIPPALTQLGAEVTLLDRGMLATGDLRRFDTIVTGTRAYAVRDDLRASNRRLLDWVRGGGNMIVLYNTPEFVPDELAPYDGSLPNNAEEVSEQAAAVEILAPAHALLTTPNRITAADFDGWIEQRGSKFFATWDDRYTALVSSHDVGQAPQRGGWLTAKVGNGRWTYMAYALHRQVPYGVPGAYRILANLITPPVSRQ